MRLRRETFLALFPERRLFFAVVCIGGIIGFYLLSIWPHQQAAQQLDLQIESLHRQISEQNSSRRFINGSPNCWETPNPPNWGISPSLPRTA